MSLFLVAWLHNTKSKASSRQILTFIWNTWTCLAYPVALVPYSCTKNVLSRRLQPDSNWRLEITNHVFWPTKLKSHNIRREVKIVNPLNYKIGTSYAFNILFCAGNGDRTRTAPSGQGILSEFFFRTISSPYHFWLRVGRSCL